MKPSIPKGTRDFSPSEMVKRNYIFDTIKSVFHRYGFLQIETPSMENMETLMGKYGEEGDRLIFRIEESGDGLHKKKFPLKWDDLKNASWDDYKEPNFTWNSFAGATGSTTHHIYKSISAEVVDKALRYDLTVPFARYVVQHLNEIAFPFKRFQIQPVWRADRPQKGRYREFYQCDADIIGSNSLLNEVELVKMMDDIFHKLGIAV